jgi:hypothetical protein
MILEVVTIVERTRHGSAPAVIDDIILLHLGSVKMSRYSILRLRIWTSRVFDRVYIATTFRMRGVSFEASNF